MKIKYTTVGDGKAPFKKHDTDAGFDLFIREIEYSDDGKKANAKLGIKTEIPYGHFVLVFPRSSIRNTGMRLSNGVGVIDSEYRGEWGATFDIINPDKETHYKVGDRCAQAILFSMESTEWDKVDSLETSDRGEGGFGSTGAN